MQLAFNAGAQRLISFFAMIRRDFLKLAAGAAVLLAGCKPSNEPPAEERTIKRIAFGSCADQDAAQPIWDVIASASPDMFVFIGDNIYADTEDMELMAKRYQHLQSINRGRHYYRPLYRLSSGPSELPSRNIL